MTQRPPSCRIGLISDTHGLLRPEVLDYLAGVDHIVHAGDIGGAFILEALAAIAPVTAVRGNNDHGPWAQALPERVTVQLAGVCLHVVHDLAELNLDPTWDAAQVVVTGHSHQPRVHEEAGRLFVNPGSAGPRRFRLPISAGELRVDAGRVHANLRHFEAP